MKTFIDLIETQAEMAPNATAITHGKKSISYGSLLANIRRVHQGALDAGLVKGDNVLFICKPDIKGLSLALGLLHAGVSVSIIDPFTSHDLFINRCSSARITHVVAPAILYRLSNPTSILGRSLNAGIANINLLEAKKLFFGSVFGSRKVDAKKWLAGRVPVISSDAEENDSAVIVFTSGTTSAPKGVVHSFKSLSASINPTAEALGIEAGIKVYSEPMTIGLVSLSVGAEWIIPIEGESFPQDCNVWFGTPKEILDGLEIIEQSGTPPRALTTVAAGAAPVLPSLVERIEAVLSPLPPKIKTVYGMTEMLPIAIGDATMKKERVMYGDYIGSPLPNVAMEISADGEVFISGDGLCKGYTSTPGEIEELREVSPLGTGDIGEMLPNGHLVLKGRKKEMFIRGSMNVYPGLYEPALSSIVGVKQAIIVGIPDVYGDDEIILAILPDQDTGKEKVKAAVEMEMSKYMDKDSIPSEVILIETLPVSGRANKLDRAQLMRTLIEMRKEKKADE